MQREEQIELNKERMRQLNIPLISESLSSLVDSKGTRKRKDKPRNDPNYDPNEEINSLEVTERVSMVKKKKQKCIAPLSLHRVLRDKRPQGMSAYKPMDQNQSQKKVTTHDVPNNDVPVKKVAHNNVVPKQSTENNKKKSPPCHAVINMAEFLRKKCEEP
ncbi:unnamed protein product, partial [Cuscuta epithymum]